MIQNSAIDNIEVEDYDYQGRGCTLSVPSGDSTILTAGTLCFALSGDCKRSRNCGAIGSVSGQVNAQNSATGVTIADCQGWSNTHANDLIAQDFYEAADYQVIYDISLNYLLIFYNL